MLFVGFIPAMAERALYTAGLHYATRHAMFIHKKTSTLISCGLPLPSKPKQNESFRLGLLYQHMPKLSIALTAKKHEVGNFAPTSRSNDNVTALLFIRPQQNAVSKIIQFAFNRLLYLFCGIDGVTKA